MESSTAVGGAVSLEDFVGSAFDGMPPGSASSDAPAPSVSSEESTPGAPPVESPDTPDADPTEPAGDDDAPEASAGDESPTDDLSAEATPDTTDATDYDAIVAAAQPLAYRVNGHDRTFEDLKVIPGGAIIRDEALPKLQQRLSERDTLYERSQQDYQRYHALEQLTAWKTTGPDGKEQILTGPQALEAQRVELGKATAILNTIAAVFDSPDLLRSILTIDGQGNVIPDPTALKSLTTQAELAAIKAEQWVRSQFQSRATATPSSHPEAAAPDLHAIAPSVIDGTAQQLGVTGLTPEDKTFLASMLPRFVRGATAQDQILAPALKLGEPVVDTTFGELMQQQASLRSSSAKTVQAATAVSKENAARLAAAKQGKTVVQQHLRTTPQRREAPVDTRAEDADNAFAMMQRASAGRF